MLLNLLKSTYAKTSIVSLMSISKKKKKKKGKTQSQKDTIKSKSRKFSEVQLSHL